MTDHPHRPVRLPLVGDLWLPCLLSSAVAVQLGCAGCREPSGSSVSALATAEARAAPAKAASAKTTRSSAAPGETRRLPLFGARSAAGLSSETSSGAPCTGRRARKAVLCVDATAAPDGNGSAARPFSQLQAAVDAAKSGALIQVAGGHYRQNVRVVRKALRLLGGFVGLSGVPAAGGARRFDSTRTPSKTVSSIAPAGGGAVVSLIQTRGSLLEGFRLSGGSGHVGDEASGNYGGGVFVSEGSARIRYNLIENNDVASPRPERAPDSVGGGIFCESANVEIIGNMVRNNRAGRGAVAVNGGKVEIAGNAIEDNLAVGDHGGGLYLSGPEIRVTANLIRGNRIRPHNGEGGWGGGLIAFDKGTHVILQRNLVTNNYAPDIGSGEFIDDGARATIRNELIVANRCSRAGSGLYVDGLDPKTPSSAVLQNVTIAGHRCLRGQGHGLYIENSSVRVHDSIVWGNGGEDYHLTGESKLEVAHTLSQQRRKGPGNRQGNPRFADPPRDYHLQSTAGRWDGRWVTDKQTSPALDAGDPATPAGDEPAPNGRRINLGAYGGTTEASRSPKATVPPK